ncbi:MAG: molybdopterin cofactor-binding domain-containing protein, partial [Cloacibacillus sp.]
EAHYEHAPESNPASFGVHFAQVTVDKLTGLVKIDKYLAVHDVGQSINRNFVDGQIYGGVQMGIGMALCEELAFDKNGMPKAGNFDKYHMINAPDMPDVDIMLIEDGEPGGPYGGKSIGEISTVPVSAAIVNAVNRALGTELTELPLTPAKIAASTRR